MARRKGSYPMSMFLLMHFLKSETLASLQHVLLNYRPPSNKMDPLHLPTPKFLQFHFTHCEEGKSASGPLVSAIQAGHLVHCERSEGKGPWHNAALKACPIPLQISILFRGLILTAFLNTRDPYFRGQSRHHLYWLLMEFWIIGISSSMYNFDGAI